MSLWEYELLARAELSKQEHIALPLNESVKRRTSKTEVLAQPTCAPECVGEETVPYLQGTDHGALIGREGELTREG